jgi:hypothetical protein
MGSMLCEREGERDGLLCRGNLAGMDDDEQLHEIVIDFSTATLNDKDVFVPHILFDFNFRLTVGEEAKLNLQIVKEKEKKKKKN